jgi:parvulin-like peptidyl-prolyl isomerase
LEFDPMKSYLVPAFAVAAFAVACGATDNPDVAAKVGDQELSVSRLATILGNSQAPLEKDVARSIAELWVNYQLVGLAGANNDSLNDPKELDLALWSNLDNIRVKKLYDKVSAGWDTLSPGPDEQRYANGEALAARHILIKVDEGATPEQRQAARRKADDIKKQVTPANFRQMAARSDEPGAGERGGDLGLWNPGTMVPDFEKAVKAIKPGEISDVIETSFGYHIIYRTPFSEISEQFAPVAKQRNVAIAESTYLARVEQSHDIKMGSNVAVKARAIARNPLGHAKDNDKLATYKGGELTAGEFADWVAAYPPTSQIRPQLISPQTADSMVEKFVRQIVRNELVLRQADSAKMVVDSAEKSNLYMAFANNLSQTWTALGVDPARIADSAKAGGDKKAIAAKRIEEYFDKMVKNEAQFVDVAYPVARALQKKYPYSVNDAGLDKAVKDAAAVRATVDSTRAKTAPGQGTVPSPDSALRPPVPPAGTRPPGGN